MRAFENSILLDKSLLPTKVANTFVRSCKISILPDQTQSRKARYNNDGLTFAPTAISFNQFKLRLTLFSNLF